MEIPETDIVTVVLDGSATAADTYKDAITVKDVTIVDAEDNDVKKNYKINTETADITISYLTVADLADETITDWKQVYNYSAADSDNGWYKSAFTISAATGYSISNQNTDSTDFASELTYIPENEGENIPRIAIKETATGYITALEKLSEINFDSQKPETDEIVYSDASAYKKLLEDITFGFYKIPAEVTFKATDATSGVASITYTIGDGDPVTVTELDYNDVDNYYYTTVEINEEFKGQVSYYATDNAGWDSDIRSDDKGIIVDTNDPVITSINYNAEKKGDKYYSPIAVDNAVDYAVIEFEVEEEYFYEEYSKNADLLDVIKAIEDAVTVNITKDDYSDAGVIDYTNFVKEFDEDHHKIIVKIPTVDNDGDYIINLTYSDPAGNDSNTVETETIVIDTTAPIVEISYEDDVASNRVEGYFLNRTATITITERNFTTDYIETTIVANDIFTLNDEAESIDTEANKQLDNIRDYNAWNHNGNIHTFTIGFTDDAVYSFDFSRLDDYANNEMSPKEDNEDIFENGTETPTAFTVDKTAPVDVKIEFSEQHTVFETITNLVFWFFNPDKDEENLGACTVTLTATDLTSGIQYFQYSCIGKDGIVTKNIVDAKVFDWKQDKNDPSVFTCSFDIEPQFRGLVSASAVDNSGNSSETKEDSNTIVVDTEKAVLTIANISSPINTDKGIKYYNDDVTITVDVTEKNFMDGEFPEDVKAIEISADIINDKGEVLKETYDISDWSRIDNPNTWRGSFRLTNEGDYTITINYTDMSGNKADTCTFSNITIDKTAPIVEVSYDDEIKENTRLGEGYFTKRTATIKVVEHNFAPENLKENISITAKDLHGDDIEPAKTNITDKLNKIYDAKNWNTDENDPNVHTFTIEYSADAIYEFKLNSFKDFAGWEMNPENNNKVSLSGETPEKFTVDSSAPENLKISYNTPLTSLIIEKLTFGFYQAVCEVTISAEDNVSDVQYFLYWYDVTKDSVNPEDKGGSLEQIKAAASNSNGEYTFFIPAQFRGQVTAVAANNAGVETDKVTDENNRIIVDTIAPNVSVTYISNGNVSYYTGTVPNHIIANNFASADQAYYESIPVLGYLMRQTIQMKWYDDYEATLLEKVNSIIEMFHHYLFASTELEFLLSDLSQGKEPDFEERCNIFKYGEITTAYTHMKDGVEQEYYIRTVLEYYILLVNKFLEMKPNVQRCKCCGNFFVTKTKRKTLYCDRALYKGGKTCKDVAPKAMQKHLAKNDEIIKAYDRTKNKMYKRLQRTETFGETEKSITYDEYADWLFKAQQAKKDYLDGKLSAENALKIILAE